MSNLLLALACRILWREGGNAELLMIVYEVTVTSMWDKAEETMLPTQQTECIVLEPAK